MDLATQLATVCVRVKCAADLPVLRDQFEGLSNEEESLRSYADRLGTLADSRAAREDQSLGGYVSTGANRLLPVPHTGTEAAVRLPLIGAAGVAGSVLGRHIQDEASARSLLKAAPRVDPSVAYYKGVAPLPDKMNSIWKFLTSPRLGSALKATPKELQHIYRGGGAIAGLAAGSALTGLPLAIRALLQKRQGGEAAVRARGRQNEASQQADEKANAREDILAQIGSSKTANYSEKLERLLQRRDPDGIERKKKAI